MPRPLEHCPHPSPKICINSPLSTLQLLLLAFKSKLPFPPFPSFTLSSQTSNIKHKTSTTMFTPQNYALHSILLAYALAFASLLLQQSLNDLRHRREMITLYVKYLSFPHLTSQSNIEQFELTQISRPRTHMTSLKPNVPPNLWNQCYRARCAHKNALGGFPFSLLLWNAPFPSPEPYPPPLTTLSILTLPSQSSPSKAKR